MRGHRGTAGQRAHAVPRVSRPATAGELRVWSTPWHETRLLPTLRAMLGLPFEHVRVSHSEPAHTPRTSGPPSTATRGPILTTPRTRVRRVGARSVPVTLIAE